MENKVKTIVILKKVGEEVEQLDKEAALNLFDSLLHEKFAQFETREHSLAATQIFHDILEAPDCRIIASDAHGAVAVSDDLPNFYLLLNGNDDVTVWIVCPSCAHEDYYDEFSVHSRDTDDNEDSTLAIFCPKCDNDIGFVV